MPNEINKPEIFQYLSGIVQSPGWQKVIKPAIKGRIADLVVAIVDEQERDRDGNYTTIPADKLQHYKALVKTLNWLLEWENQVEVLAREIEQSLAARERRRPNAVGSLFDDEE